MASDQRLGGRYYDLPSGTMWAGFRREIGWGHDGDLLSNAWCFAWPTSEGQMIVRIAGAYAEMDMPAWLCQAWLASEPVEPLLDWLIENTDHADMLQEFVRRMTEARAGT